jgi:hypothetical protein
MVSVVTAEILRFAQNEELAGASGNVNAARKARVGPVTVDGRTADGADVSPRRNTS